MNRDRVSLLWPALLLAVITLGVYCPILRNDFAGIWDDDKYIANNEDYNPPTLKKLVHYWVPPPKEEFFVPVLYTLWGLVAMGARSVSPAGVVTFNAMPYHALSIAAHVGSAIFAFLILYQLSRSRAAAFLGAAVFALHPVQVEAVAWASTLYTPLCAMFCLLAIWQFLAATDADETLRSRRFAIHYAIASAAFLLAMLTKPAALSAPLMIAAIEIGLRKRSILKMVLPLGAWVVVAVIIVSITRGAVPATNVGHTEPWERVVVALDAITFYLYRMLSPFGIAIDYGRSPGWVVGHFMNWILFFIPAAIFASARLLRKKLPILNSAMGVFLAALFPTLGFASFSFQKFSTVADRYAYLGLFAAAMLIAFAFRRIPAVIAIATATIVVPALSILTMRQIPKWQNEWTLFEKTLRDNPSSAIVAGNLQYMLTPTETAKCTLSAEQLEGMGDRMMQQKRSKLAGNVYTMSVDRDAKSATYAKLASAQLQTELRKPALESARKAVQLSPNDAAARAMLDEAEQANALTH